MVFSAFAMSPSGTEGDCGRGLDGAVACGRGETINTLPRRKEHISDFPIMASLARHGPPSRRLFPN